MNHTETSFIVILIDSIQLSFTDQFPDRADTQPTSCRWEALPDSSVKRRLLGGTKVGNGAWGLAWVDTVMEFPDPPTETSKAEYMEKLRKDAEESADNIIDLT